MFKEFKNYFGQEKMTCPNCGARTSNTLCSCGLDMELVQKHRPATGETLAVAAAPSEHDLREAKRTNSLVSFTLRRHGGIPATYRAHVEDISGAPPNLRFTAIEEHGWFVIQGQYNPDTPNGDRGNCRVTDTLPPDQLVAS